MYVGWWLYKVEKSNVLILDFSTVCGMVVYKVEKSNVLILDFSSVCGMVVYKMEKSNVLILDFSSVCGMVVYKVEKSNVLTLLRTYWDLELKISSKFFEIFFNILLRFIVIVLSSRIVILFLVSSNCYFTVMSVEMRKNQDKRDFGKVKKPFVWFDGWW